MFASRKITRNMLKKMVPKRRTSPRRSQRRKVERIMLLLRKRPLRVPQPLLR